MSDAATIPLILTPLVLPTRLTLVGRAIALLVALACLSVLIFAAYLSPSPTGTATHTRLGFANCQFLASTGVPCPTCGMTTSTAHFVRGHFLASFYIQPMGFLFAILCAATFWTSLYIAISGRPAYRLLSRLPMNRIVIALLGFTCAAWAWKILIHLNGMDGWR